MKLDYSETDDLDGDPGIVLEYKDAPEDEPIGQADAATALDKMTKQMISILAGTGVHPALCEGAEFQITQMWVNALRTVSGERSA